MTHDDKVVAKKKYTKPIVKTLGDIKHTTRGSGTANGDGGMGMMA